MSDYNFAYLDEQTKRMIRRATLKGLAIPRCQVPFANREMPIPYGWGKGGVQVSAAEMTKADALQDYGLMRLKLYEDISAHGVIATAYPYTVKIEWRYVMNPSPMPKFGNPK